MNQFNECTKINQVDDSSNATAATATTASVSQSKPTTLVLQFSHSTNECTAMVSQDDDTINSPLDIYRKFGKLIEEKI